MIDPKELKIYRPDTVEQRFFDKVYPEPNAGCWIWGGGCNNNGYGIFKAGGKAVLAHRYSFEYHNGRKLSSSKEVVCHRCNCTYCVNPAHLYSGTQLINVEQANKEGRLAKKMHQSIPVLKISKEGQNLAVYPSMKQASRQTGVSQEGISKCISGEIKSCGGFIWKKNLPDSGIQPSCQSS